jgi:hypothetical protein
MAKRAFFMRRLNDHIQYLKKMDATFKGEKDFRGTTHRGCKLGEWLYSEGWAEVSAMENSKATEVFQSLLEPHERFHLLSNDALEKKQAGDERAAYKLFTELHVLSNTLTNKLLELDGLN